VGLRENREKEELEGKGESVERKKKIEKY